MTVKEFVKSYVARNSIINLYYTPEEGGYSIVFLKCMAWELEYLDEDWEFIHVFSAVADDILSSDAILLEVVAEEGVEQHQSRFKKTIEDKWQEGRGLTLEV